MGKLRRDLIRQILIHQSPIEKIVLALKGCDESRPYEHLDGTKERIIYTFILF
jgi:hypothetical protein